MKPNRGPDGKFLSKDGTSSQDRERRETLARLSQGWERAIARLRIDVEKMKQHRSNARDDRSR